MTMSAVPSPSRVSVSSASFGVWNRDSCRMSIGNWLIRSENVL